MSENSMVAEKSNREKWLNINTLLAFLIATLSMLTAYAAYKSAEIDSTSTDNYFLAQSHLNDANSLYLERGQDIIYDFNAYDSHIIYQDSNPEISDYYFDQLSDEALASMERPDGPFDREYYDAMYIEPKTILEEEEFVFDNAAHDSNRAVAYQLTVLIMAVGLSFAAWASLADEKNNLRPVFLVLSLITLVVGLIQMFSIPGPLTL